MAKTKPTTGKIGDLFKRTDKPTTAKATPTKTTERGRNIPVSVGLFEAELAELQEIATKHGTARNQVMAFAVRHFLAQYRAGKVSLVVKPKPAQIQMPN